MPAVICAATYIACRDLGVPKQASLDKEAFLFICLKDKHYQFVHLLRGNNKKLPSSSLRMN
jgi:hypothetical protein